MAVSTYFFYVLHRVFSFTRSIIHTCFKHSEAHLESMMESFSKNSQWPLNANYFHKKAPSQMADSVPNTPMTLSIFQCDSNTYFEKHLRTAASNTRQKMKYSIKDFFSKCDQTAVFCGFGHIY